MSESLIFFEQIAHSPIFGQKMSDALGNQMSEFSALSQLLFLVLSTVYWEFCLIELKIK